MSPSSGGLSLRFRGLDPSPTVMERRLEVRRRSRWRISVPTTGDAASCVGVGERRLVPRRRSRWRAPVSTTGGASSCASCVGVEEQRLEPRRRSRLRVSASTTGGSASEVGSPIS